MSASMAKNSPWFVLLLSSPMCVQSTVVLKVVNMFHTQLTTCYCLYAAFINDAYKYWGISVSCNLRKWIKNGEIWICVLILVIIPELQFLKLCRQRTESCSFLIVFKESLLYVLQSLWGRALVIIPVSVSWRRKNFHVHVCENA